MALRPGSSRGATRGPLMVTAGFLGLYGISSLAQSASGDTELVSISARTGSATGLISSPPTPSVSADGRYVAFTSDSPAVVANDTNGVHDVFVRDRLMGVTQRVSVGAGGAQGNDGSFQHSISANGRYVAYASLASNLIVGDTNNTLDVFVRDRQAGTVERVSVNSTGAQANDPSDAPAISADGRYVAFRSDASNLVAGDTTGRDIFVNDRQTGVTEKVSVSSSGVSANNFSDAPAISADGRYVAFESSASNLVPGDTRGNDIFVRDRQAGLTERVNVSSGGMQANDRSAWSAISADGRYVTFKSMASNLVPNDTNETWDIFVHDRQSGITERVSVSSSGAQANAQSDWPESPAAMSADNRYVSFESLASNLVAGDTNGRYDIFVHDRQSGATQRVNVDENGAQSSGHTAGASISASGQFVTFVSLSRLVANDTNDTSDVYVHELAPAASVPFTLTPAELNFGKQARGVASAARAVQLKNTSATSLPITSVALTGQNPHQFSFVSHCGSSVASGAECSIDIMFKPTSVGLKAASLIVSLGSGAGSQAVSLSGQGVSTQFTLRPITLDFGVQAVGTVSVRLIVTLTNLSEVPLPIRGIGIGGAQQSQFGFNSRCGKELAVGARCTVFVVFKPTSVGAKSALITVKAAGGAQDKTVTLLGQGI
jgi:Tol biopolymer transport system component